VGGEGCGVVFWDARRDLRGSDGPGGGGGATLRRAGEFARAGDEPLAEAALGRRGGGGGAVGGGGVDWAPSPPCVLRAGIAGATREGADDTGLAGGGGGGALPGVIDAPDPLRAGRIGGAGTMRAGGAGAVDAGEADALFVGDG